MIFFRVDIELLSKLVSKEKLAFEKSDIWQYNISFLDAYEENNVSLILQFATIDTALHVLSYAVYEPQSIIRGVIDVEQDVIEACKFIKIPSGVCHVVYKEISASDYNRALQRYDIKTSRLWDFTSKSGLDCFRYNTYGYKLSERVVEDDVITDKKTAKTAMKKLLPDAAMTDEINHIFSSGHPRDMYYSVPYQENMRKTRKEKVTVKQVTLYSIRRFECKRTDEEWAFI